MKSFLFKILKMTLLVSDRDLRIIIIRRTCLQNYKQKSKSTKFYDKSSC